MANVTIETDLDTLLASMAKWKPDDDVQAFNELCASALFHGAILTSRNGMSFPILASALLKIHTATFDRWCRGESAPHPLGRASAIKMLRNMLIQLRNDNKMSTF